MDGNGNIRLDPDVIESVEGGRIPLCDLYELPVFTSAAAQEAGRLYTEEAKMLRRIRKDVFAVEGQGEETVWLADIRSQIFEAAPGLVMAKGAGERETVREPRLPAEIIVIGCAAVILGACRVSKLWRNLYGRHGKM